MWFVTLVHASHAPKKEDAPVIQEAVKEAESWGVKFHQVFFTLGPYDSIWITEAPDEKTMMKVAMLVNSKVGDQTTTMPAISFEEFMG